MLKEVVALYTADLVREVVVNKDILGMCSNPDGGKLNLNLNTALKRK